MAVASSSVWTPTRGATVWAKDDAECFVKTLVYQVDGNSVETEVAPQSRSIEDVYPMNPESQDGVPDHTMMDFLYDANLLHNISVRYGRDEIYSYIAYILIAVNPYKKLPIYDEDVMWGYRKGSMGSLPPHVYAIAERSFRHMLGSKRSQSIVCSGDSGAGKTETAKYVLRYLTTIAGSGAKQVTPGKNEKEGKGDNEGKGESEGQEKRGMLGGQRQRGMMGGQRQQQQTQQTQQDTHNERSVLEKRILDANPILEAFGNAKTLRNNNSSRFGKFVRVHFGESHCVSGADITTYLLEKSRLAIQPSKERNFHIFYQLLSGASKEERNAWLLDDLSAQKFRYTSQSACIKIDDVDDAADYQVVRDAMTVSGLSVDEQNHLLSLLAALLHFGNISFDEIDKENTESSLVSEDGREGLKRFCELAKCPINVVENALIQRTMVTKDSTFVIPLKKVDAEFARDTLAKYVYGGLFDYVVKKINSGMPLKEESKQFIGILDISGFEYFDNNGFEQFLINYCNEKIQQYFIQQILHQEQNIYLQEGLRWKTVHFDDNFKCLELIELKSHGILALLQEQCMLPKGTDERFTSNLTKVMFSNEKLMLVNKVPKKMKKIPGLGKKHFKNEDAFIIRHFAADVCYQTRGWLVKNNDGIHSDLMNVLKGSGSPILSSLLKSENAEDVPFASQGKGESKSTRFSTVSSKFFQDLSGLMESLSVTESHFIRCINPNIHRAPLQLNRNGVMAQLRCSGMLEALRIMQAGFPTRCLFTDLYDRYKQYCPPEFTSLGPKLFCEALLVALDLQGGSDFQMGLSRVFFRAGKAAMMDDIISGDPATLERVAGKIRQWLARKRWRQSIWAVISILRLGRLIEDIREERRKREEAKRLASEEYQRELRKKREEEERLLREELRRKEEEERRRREEEERLRREKLARKEEKEKRLRLLQSEAEGKKDLQFQLDNEREMYERNERELLEEVDSLESEIETHQKLVESLDKELAEARSHERALNEMKNMSDDEIDKLRKIIESLEYKIRTTQHQVNLANDNLSQLKDLHRTTVTNWEVKYKETLEMKDEELARVQDEGVKKIAQLEKEMKTLMDEMKRQAELQIQRVVEEREMELTRVEVMADEMLTVMEQSKAQVTKKGYMFKYEETLMGKKWKKYYFCIKSNFLAWYHDRNAEKPLGIIDLEDGKVEKTESKKKKYEGCEFKISVPSGSGFRTLMLRVDYGKDRSPWMEAMAMAKSRHIAAGTINLDRYDVAAVKAGLVGGHTMTQSMISPRDKA